MMDIDLSWRALRWTALERLHVHHDDAGGHAEAVISGSFDDAPLELKYQLDWDSAWRTSAFRLVDLSSHDQLEIENPSGGGWRDVTGARLADLVGATDVDLSATPFTNTFPIRRLALQTGGSAEITAVYVVIGPGLSVRPARQRYTRLEDGLQGQRYMYESLESDFKREIQVDHHGFVIDYPGIWTRIDP
jgi:hypothetical protein